VRRSSDQECQQTAAEKANRKQPAAPLGRDRAGHDVVVRNRDDAADEGIDGPHDEEDRDNQWPGQFRPNPQESGQSGKAYGASESTRHIERHPAGAALRDIADDQLRQQPPGAGDGCRCTDRDRAAPGQPMHEGRDNRPRVYCRRTTLEENAGR